MAITYEEALATLQSMFGPPWTRQLLDGVLRHFNGHMENTVDAVLTHGNRDPAQLLQNLKDGNRQSQASLDAALAQQLAQEEERNANRSRGARPPVGQRQLAAQRNAAPPAPAPAPSKPGRGTPTTLPDDFLRIPGMKASPANNAANNIDTDEALARMLQDELFSQELARNPDFAHLARGRRANHTNSTQRTAGQQRRNSNEDGPNLLKGIADLGDAAKRRLQILAAQFNATTGRIQRPNQNTNVQHAAVDAERRGLLDDDDDYMEMTFRKDK